MLPISLYAKTDIGKERETNEDSVASLLMTSQSHRNILDYGIIVVADGMGGLEKGEVASEIATKKFIEVVTESIIYSTTDNGKINFSEILVKAIQEANKSVFAISGKYTDKTGTTLIGAIIVDRHYYIANVGDSRAYLIKPAKTILQITKDHSVVQEMLDNNVITKEQAIIHPRRNLLTKALGLSENIQPDIYEDVIKDELLLLCSDGLYGMLNENEISKNVKRNISKSIDNLIARANKNGGIDNISVAIAKYND